MIVSGYRTGANFMAAEQVITKHTAFSKRDAKHIVDHIKEGKCVNLPDDWVLREDLEDLQFKVE
tara:strand:+ start:424 stop:615 length:192 start_codon:yes stop_codon:yes gene_type:complete